MKHNCFILSAFCVLALSLLITGCGGGALSSTGNGGNNNSNLKVTTSSMTAATVGTAYTASLQATGGTAPYTWTLKSGALPAGISLSSDGSISGTPSAAGTAGSLVFQVTDASSNSASSGNLSLKVNPEAAPVVQTAVLNDGNVGVAYSTALTATGGTKPYTWSIKSGSLPAGLALDAATGAITGTPTASGTSALVFSVSDFYNTVGLSGSLSVKIDSVVQVTTTSLPSGTEGAAYTSSLTATGGSGVYAWSLKSGTLPAGLSLNASTGEISGTPTAASIFSGLVFQATDADTAIGVSAPLSLQVYNALGCSSGAESNLGTQSYAFLIKGFEPSTGNLAPVTIIGSVTTDGQGGITAGEEDINSSSGAQSQLAIVPASSSYSLGPDNNGCLVLTTSAGTTNLHFSVSTPNGSNVFTQGHVMLDNSSGTGARGSGILRLQDSSAFAAGLTGMYTFLFVGTDGASGNFGMAGSFASASGNITNLAFDADDAGTVATGITGGTGTYSATDSYGRGTASVSALITGNPYNLDSVYYVINSTEVLFASTDLLKANPICSGRAFATNSADFSAAFLQNNYVAHATGLMVGGIPQVLIMTGSFDGVSAGSGYVAEDQGGTVTNWLATDNYAVDATTGRVTFTGTFITPVGYLVTGVNGISAVLVGNDYPATTATLEPQLANATPASGLYSIGSEMDADFLTGNQIGTFNLSSANFSGTESLSNAVSPFLVENQSVANSFTIGTNGTGTFWGNPAVSTGSVIYFIDERGGTNTHPAIVSVTK
ncbi:MAG TPA: putative Ig domain-containing protein [Candidatus Eisenbacteria bacterium]|nr:putative Ig domain-containing protein [Candidatus Eisenbacteria bacterium]